MIKKVFKLIICIFIISFIFMMPLKTEAKTLRELKNELAETIANKEKIEAQRAAAKRQIEKYRKDISESSVGVNKCEEDIEAARKKIDELNEEIIKKNKEIDELLRFIQIANGENVYLEYIFGATGFADFIYRITVVEQLTSYNDELVDEMYDLIEKNKQLQKDLEKKIKELNNQIIVFQKKLSTLNISLDDLDDDRQSLSEEIKIFESEIKFYEGEGCKLDEDLTVCTNIPYSNSFTRPLVSGRITSNFGKRTVDGVVGYHRGIDIGISDGTKVYASAAGKVSVVSYRNECGGNMVYIQHNINGKRYTSVYMHLLSINVKKHDYVNINTVIGLSGGYSTAKRFGGYDRCSTGAHLHFGIMEGHTTSSSASKDPRNFINFPAKGSKFYSRW